MFYANRGSDLELASDRMKEEDKLSKGSGWRKKKKELEKVFSVPLIEGTSLNTSLWKGLSISEKYYSLLFHNVESLVFLVCYRAS